MGSTATEVIRVDSVSKTFNLHGRNEIHAIDTVSFSIQRNEFLTIVGPSGCGKSTLLFILVGLTEPTSGRIFYKDQLLKGPNREFGIVFQEDAVFPWCNVRDNVSYGLKRRRLASRKVDELTDYHLQLVGLHGYQKLWPKELSGGMRKRVDLARALANNPEVIFMDEPFGALDVITKQKLQVEIGKIFESLKRTVFFVTHDLEEAIFLSDRIIVSTERPGNVKAVCKIPFERPRSPDLKTAPEFQKLRKELGELLYT